MMLTGRSLGPGVPAAGSVLTTTPAGTVSDGVGTGRGSALGPSAA